ncbi:U11/U12 small nuclear ribonucleoprotein 65 kDa protein [Paragonimus westermani]|uniref:U11/U12 small nuclear ribonucleoprotein 65 kDa protein n=1 Tax=Paragonimus westermani TaxID=34504 RepID=A0A5J4NG81_9TREM|nr:U11/U12 small nuclear ribonucleoprotein 65 kDa protein [Paragonimus westermani]
MSFQFVEASADKHKLLFKHFPRELTEKECTDFLANLGALSTQYFGNRGPFKNCAVAEFPSLKHAWEVIKGVHQRLIVDSRLCVEFYRPNAPLDSVPSEGVQCNKSTGAPSFPESCLSKCGSHSSPIAPKWDIWVPVSKKLRYRYPSATVSVLTNIVRAMVSCPAFYTQVLHLMNRLHLPPPFGDSELFPGTLTVTSEPTATEQMPPAPTSEPQNDGPDVTEAMDLSSGTESEMESDVETVGTSVSTTLMKQPLRRRKRKKTSQPTDFIPSTKNTPLPHSSRSLTVSRSSATNVCDLFETVTPSSKMQIHVPPALPSAVQSGRNEFANVSTVGFGLLSHPTDMTTTVSSVVNTVNTSRTNRPSDIHREEFRLRKKTDSRESSPDEDSNHVEQSVPEDDSDDELSQLDSFSLNDLRVRRLSPEERQNYAVFARNYEPGEPTSRLYIKNLAPSVTERELYRVYGAFQFGPVTDLDFRPKAPSSSTDRFSIRLLTGGRMKGQAFISLQCELTAAQALEATNGLLLHDRPIVAQFARGAKAKFDEKTLIQR